MVEDIKLRRLRCFNKQVKKSLYYLTVCLLAVFIYGCGNNEESHEGHNHSHEGHSHSHEGHDHSHEGEEHSDSEETGGHGNDIVLSEAQAKAAGVECRKITGTVFSGVVPVGGRVLPASGQESTVVATMSGIVRLTRPIREGEAVSAGAGLFHISSNKLPEGDVTRRADIALRKAQADYERVKQLAAERLATQSEVNEARAAYENARLERELAGSAGGKTVSATMSGYIKDCLVKNGEYVEVGQPLMTITQSRRLQLRAEVPEREYHNLNKIVSAKFRTAYSGGYYDLRNMGGRVVSVGKTSTGGSPYIPVIFEFDNVGGVVSGSYAEIKLLTSTGTSVLAVPNSALTEEQGVYYIYIKEDKDCYRKQPVEIGSTDGEFTEIKNGLKDGENVVTRGAMHVRLAGASKSIPGHSHSH